MEEKNNSGEINTQRLEAFSDGVFAIAITLLVLEIKIPGKELLRTQSLAQYLAGQWPQYFAYLFSFISIGIYWANHHYLFKLFVKTDHWFNLLNVFFLLCISFLPYPTEILGEYARQPDQLKTAVGFYSLGILLPALGWNLIWIYASRGRRLLDPRLSPAFCRQLSLQFHSSFLLYLAAFLISLVNPYICMALEIALLLLYLWPPKKPRYLDPLHG